MTEKVLSWALGQIRDGKKTVIASVIHVKGSVPGKVGARLAVAEGVDKVEGTVGGAGLEFTVISRCNELLKEQEKPFGEVNHYGLNKGAKGFEITPLDSLCGGQVTISIELIIPSPHILMMGGGHCAQALADLIPTLGWNYSVQDSRAEYANDALFPIASKIHACSVEDFFSEYGTSHLSTFSELLLLGHDWKEDEQRLLSILEVMKEYEDKTGQKLDRPHIGVIGSRSKWTAFEKKCIEEGFSQELLDRIQCPIGLTIGAESPEEIAVAVLADILARHKNVEPTSTSWRTQN